MEVLFDRVAGLDVHRDSVTGCVRAPRPAGRGRASTVAEYATTAAGLRRLHEWLTGESVTHVAMEATGIYWRPVFNALEDDFEVLLVNAAHVKNVPGRKSAWNGRLLPAARCVVIREGATYSCGGADHAQSATGGRRCPCRVRRQQERVGGGDPAGRRGDAGGGAGLQRRVVGAPLREGLRRARVVAHLL